MLLDIHLDDSPRGKVERGIGEIAATFGGVCASAASPDVQVCHSEKRRVQRYVHSVERAEVDPVNSMLRIRGRAGERGDRRVGRVAPKEVEHDIHSVCADAR